MRWWTWLVAVGCHRGDGGGPSLPQCTADRPLTVSPLADGDFAGLVPLGNLNPSGHTLPTDHVYFYLPFDGGTAPDVVPVVLPGDGWITQIAASEHVSASPPFTDYALTFQPCDEQILVFGHISSLDPALAAQLTGDAPCDEYTTGGQAFRYCRYDLKIPVSAGDPLGTAGGNPGQYALDLGAFDLRGEALPFANLERILADNERLPYVVCPADLFAADVADALGARFSNHDGSVLRTAEPRCGSVMQDLPGTAQGIWINAASDELYPEDPHLSFVHDNVDPSVPVLSIGTAIPDLLGAHAFTAEASGVVNRDPADLSADGTVTCYALPGVTGAVLAEMPSATELRVEHQPAADCASPPWALGAGAVDFAR